MDAQEWKKLWKEVVELQEGFEPGAIFIGGVAVFAHTVDSQYKKYFAFSHDADFMISVADYTDLKDIEQVIPNRRLSKAQFYKGGFEFDVYVENQNDLSIPYDEVAAHSVIRSGVRVASLEHLLVLKLVAFEDRRGSAKGMKDEDDIFKVLMLMSENDLHPDRAARLDDDMMEMLSKVVRSDAAVRISNGNMHEASALRKNAAAGFESLRKIRDSTSKLGW